MTDIQSSNPPILQSSAPPRHVAIIMDGNGRWATRRGLPRTEGHRRGAQAVKRVVTAAAELGIKYLTLFGFSSENWSRPEYEVRELLKLLRLYLRSETAEMHKNNVRLRVIGERSGFDPDIVSLIENAEKLTAGNTGITLVIALNYGGRGEIINAARQAARDLATGIIKPEELEARFPSYLMTGDIPDPDLLIRTSGEKRISNFLLWQCAYTEFIFTSVLWPDFGRADLESALLDYAGRERRFGMIKASEA